MLISIPMAVHNGSKYINRALDSVINQTSEMWELICVDDGSTDNSADIISSYCKNDARIKLISQENSGAPKARMVAYREAKGDYVLTGLDQDDYIECDFVEKLIYEIEKTKADVVLCDWMLECSDGSFESFFQMHDRQIGKTVSGLDAFIASFPWSIHLIGAWDRRLVEGFAVKEENCFNNYDSDEFLARKIALNSHVIYLGSAKYFHCKNQESVTSTPSLRRLHSLETNDKLLFLAFEHDLPIEIVYKILLYQRNCLANSWEMLPRIQNTSPARRKELLLTSEHFQKFRSKIRCVRNNSIRSFMSSELIIVKLWLRYLIMRGAIIKVNYLESVRSAH